MCTSMNLNRSQGQSSGAVASPGGALSVALSGTMCCCKVHCPKKSNMWPIHRLALGTGHKIDLLLQVACPVLFHKHASARFMHGCCCLNISSSAHAARFLCLQDGRRGVKPGEQPVGNWACCSCPGQPRRWTVPERQRGAEALRRLHRLLQHAQTTQAQHPPLKRMWACHRPPVSWS